MKTLWLDFTGHPAQRRTEIYLSAAWVLHTWRRQTTTYVWLTFVLLFCFYAAFHKFKVANPSLESIVKVLVWGKQAGETKDTDGQAEKKKDRDIHSVKENHRGVMNQRGPDWGWKRWNVWWREAGAWGKESASMLIALIWRGWWTEDSTSALIQAHFPRTQLSDSQLSPPKNPERHRLKLQGYDAALLLLSQPDACWFCAGLI